MRYVNEGKSDPRPLFIFLRPRLSTQLEIVG